MPAQPESVTLAFPDGAQRTYPCPVTGHDVAAAIPPGLAKAALAVRLDGGLRDLTRPINEDGAIEIVTPKDASPEVLELIRHHGRPRRDRGTDRLARTSPDGGRLAPGAIVAKAATVSGLLKPILPAQARHLHDLGIPGRRGVALATA